MTCAEDLLEKQRWLEPSYDVHVSGHLHKGLIYGAQSALVNEKDVWFCPVLDSCRHDHYDVCQFLCIGHLPDYILSYFGL